MIGPKFPGVEIDGEKLKSNSSSFRTPVSVGPIAGVVGDNYVQGILLGVIGKPGAGLRPCAFAPPKASEDLYLATC